MKIRIVKVSECFEEEETRENVTAKDILDLIKKFDNIIARPFDDDEDTDCDYEVIIYDDWVE